MADRIHFHKPDGTRQPANSGAPPVLVGFGAEARRRLERCKIPGALVTGWTWKPDGHELVRFGERRHHDHTA